MIPYIINATPEKRKKGTNKLLKKPFASTSGIVPVILPDKKPAFIKLDEIKENPRSSV
ncbi:hypothetical protein [Pseudalkalibacillus sp. JSM 102089]|uniref:hypothetical protein n=1 Tax=Pseudalkalibacillus sp. JSM 102089 TaxID=3229856 RepID=UPI0035236901